MLGSKPKPKGVMAGSSNALYSKIFSHFLPSPVRARIDDSPVSKSKVFPTRKFPCRSTNQLRMPNLPLSIRFLRVVLTFTLYTDG